MQVQTSTGVKTKRSYTSPAKKMENSKNEEIRLLREGHYEAICNLQDAHNETIKKKIEEAKLQVWHQVELDREADKVQRLESLERELRAKSEAELRPIIENKILDDLALQPDTRTDLQAFTMMVQSSEGFKSWNDETRHYVRVGDQFSYSIWNFDLNGKFICQSQFEFHE